MNTLFIKFLNFLSVLLYTQLTQTPHYAVLRLRNSISERKIEPENTIGWLVGFIEDPILVIHY